MIHPATQTVRISDVVGVGVVASDFLPRGTIVWTQDVLDRVFEPEDLLGLPSPIVAQLDRYAHVDERGRSVLCWDAGKLINHSCTPTLRGIGTWFQVARRDVHPGEELTCDYAECNLDSELRCACGSPQCRGQIHGSDLLRFAAAWDKEADALLNDVARVDQPLAPYLLNPAQAAAYLNRQKPLPSFRELFAGRDCRDETTS